jgi:protein SCO1/2
MGIAGAAARPAELHAQPAERGVTARVGFDQRLGALLPLDLAFQDDAGRSLRLGEIFGRKPVILVPVYYRCPLLCSQVLNGLVRSLKPLRASAGKDFDVVAYSISPDETPGLARLKKAGYLERYGRPGSDIGWHFLTGSEASITALSQAIGFRYTYNPQTKLYVHAAGLLVATPDGRIGRYFFGIDVPSKELQREIESARAGRVGSPIGRLLLLCYDYDAATGKYTLAILRLLRFLGTMTFLALAGFLLFMFRRERRSRHEWAARISQGQAGEIQAVPRSAHAN